MVVEERRRLSMLENANNIKCAAVWCEKTAANHIKFKFGVDDSDEAPYVHKNYCETHIELMRQRFPIVKLLPLPACPQNCEVSYFS